jgi:hypothetical protein
MQEQKANLVKSVPLFYDVPLPHSTVVKALLREILKNPPEPLTLDEVKRLRQRKRGRKRVYLTERDRDLQDFFFLTPITQQYAVFKKLNEKLLQEVKP